MLAYSELRNLPRTPYCVRLQDVRRRAATYRGFHARAEIPVGQDDFETSTPEFGVYGRHLDCPLMLALLRRIPYTASTRHEPLVSCSHPL